MTREEALQRISEWHVIEKTTVWNDLLDGLIRLEVVHSLVLKKSSDIQEIYRSQGATKVLNTLLRAKENQIKEANEVLEGKHRATGQPVRAQ